MSDLDSDNLLKEKRKVDPTNVNYTKDASQFQSYTENNSHKKKKNTIKYALIGGSILVAAILIIVLSVTLTKEAEEERKIIPLPPSPPPIPNIAVSPFAYQEFNNFKVESQPSSGDFNVSTILSLQIDPIQMNLQQTQQGEEPVEGILNGHDYQPVNPRDIVDGVNNKWASKVRLDFALIDNYQAQLNITNLDIPNQYEVSPEAFTRPVLSFEARFTQVGFQQSPAGEPYYFNFSDIYQNETLISTYKRKFHVTEKFSEIGFVVPTKKIFGLGQRNSQFLLKNGTYSLWAQGRKEGLPNEASEGGQNGPHIHPFILCQTKTNDFFGIFFAASSAQTFEIIYYPGYSETVVNYIQLGGKMEIYFMMRGTAQEIIQRYHALIGYSMVPPYYALGFFQGSNAYTNIDQIHKVIAGYKGSNMALEGILIDNYYAGPSQVFTVNPNNFQDLTVLQSSLASTNQHMILGLQTGISNNPNFKYYNNLINSKCYIVSTQTQKPLVGLVNGTVVYPDYTCADIDDFLTDALVALDDLTYFEGLYLQNNMLYNLANGEYKAPSQMDQYESIYLQEVVQVNEESSGTWNQSYKINKDQSKISTYNLPFLPGYYWSGNLDNQTVSLNSTHSGNVQDFYVHNINGHLSSKIIFNILNSSDTMYVKSKRPLIFSDSTWAGSGKFAAVALHDMRREWSNLRSTISQVMSFSMYGVQNVASDICGNLGPVTDEELCGRWAQLSAFLPMVRSYYNMTYWDFNTNTTQNGSQSELYNIKNYTYQFMSSAALNQRMQYSRYIYSQMYKVYREGGALVYPLLFDFPNDENILDLIDTTFMLGDSIKVSPVLTKGVTDQYQAYFPEGSWADLNQYNTTVKSNGENKDLMSDPAYTNIHLKAGKIIPFQLNSQQVKTAYDLMTKVPISFIIHRDDSQYAEGFTLVDDGISSGTWDNVDYTFWKLRYASKSINFWVNYGDFKYSPPEGYTIDSLDSIHILNAQDLANTNFACFLGLNLNPTNMTYSYNPYNYVLTLRPATGTTVKFNEIGFIKFGNDQHEPNFCDYNSAFTYEQSGDPLKIDQFSMDIPIKSMQGTKHLEELVFSIRLMDDIGTINVNITTLSDYYDSTIKFKIPYVTDFTPFKTPTKSLDQFFDFTASPFSYRIFKEGQTDVTLYQSDPHKLYFDQYLVFDSAIFSLNPLTNYPLMGMGERAGDLFYSNEQGGIHSRYSFDQANPIDDGLPPGRNMYGVQPFYVYQSVSTDWVGVFDLNSYATDYVLYFNEGTNTQITKIVIGGTIQKYFFVGDKPDAIITTYSALVGRQTVPPLWAFGWQQCRFGWKTDEDWYSVLQNYKAFDLPLDTMWADIDYMDDYKIFTISQSRYANLASNVTEIRKNNMTFVPIMDVGVAVRPNNDYYAYDQGIEQDIFIKIYNGSSPLTAGVWPGHAYFPDFWHPNADNYWSSSFDYLKNTYGLEFDGIWIDMNEATNFCNGYCVTGERPTDSLRNKPYYVPGWRDLEDKALGVDGLHANGWREYDLHSTYSLLQVKATANYLIKQGKRPYVLSRSNFPGLAEYGYHWMGDNWSTVDYMRYSVDGMYSYQLFGLPFSGSDICGFDGDAPADLCTRWHQLGSLYPFSRNHNQNATAAQEPYRFNQPYPKDPTITYTDIIKSALKNRYSYIRYYYSHFYDIGQYGGSFFKPLFFEFTADPKAYQNIQQNMMLGESLKLSIEVTTLAESTTDFYFPEGAWCQIFPYVADCFTSPAGGSTHTKRTYLTDYYIHVREGFIVPYQNATEKNVHNTKALLDVPMDLFLLPSNANKDMSTHTTPTVSAAAIGYIYFDDGVSFEDKSTRFDLIFSIPQAKQGKLQVRQVSSGYPRQSVYEQQLYKIHILYATHSQLTAVSQASYDTISKTGSFINLNAPVYDKDTDTLTIEVAASFYDINTVVFS